MRYQQIETVAIYKFAGRKTKGSLEDAGKDNPRPSRAIAWHVSSVIDFKFSDR